MRKDNMEQRSAEELTTEELEHASGGGSPEEPLPTRPRDVPERSLPGGSHDSYSGPDEY
jgi:hypothetical protein